MKNFAFILCIICTILVLGHACDPDTEYEKDGVCCKMCGPGTRMNSQGPCEDPVCTPCGTQEYQSGYTRETKCELQPYCDPNLKFVRDGPLDPKRMVPCTCKSQHHCSSEECLNCVPNTACKPGEGVVKMAIGHSDTVCEVCRQGTFSNESSPVNECRPWTKCDGKTHREKKSGTTTSDVECEEIPSNMAVKVIVPIFAVGILVAALIYYNRKDLGKLKKCLKKTPGEEDHERNIQPLIHVEEGLFPEKLIQHPAEPEDGTSDGRGGELGPEENEETQPQAQGVTDNNMPMRQEEGKEEHTSQPETDCLDHSSFTDIHFMADSSS
ncbi:hypothetical protein GJAV_G00193470 [Gymnothorax javanicus]|nr:hypothetical protein GJAV_G00193470 [Gymnothorax javanicus]